MKTAYQKYLKRVDELKGIARLPYMVVDENPPDEYYQYYRKLTFEEFCKSRRAKEEFYAP